MRLLGSLASERRGLALRGLLRAHLARGFIDLATVVKRLGRHGTLLRSRCTWHRQLAWRHLQEQIQLRALLLLCLGVARIRVHLDLAAHRIAVQASGVHHRGCREVDVHLLARLVVVRHLHAEKFRLAKLLRHLENDVVLGVLALEEAAVMSDGIALAPARELLELDVDKHEGAAWDREVADRDRHR